MTLYSLFTHIDIQANYIYIKDVTNNIKKYIEFDIDVLKNYAEYKVNKIKAIEFEIIIEIEK